MSTYDFSRLSPCDFEDLVRDLLQAEWCVRLETFTAGRDSGIDLRYFAISEGTTVIQCKHMQGSRYADLLHKLRKSEELKVRKLEPQRYVLATSVGLTPENKNEIAQLLSPYLHGSSDVLGRDDINNLLRLHPGVETGNFKLWLTSTAVMQRVLNNAEHCQTDFEIDRIIRKLPVFVQSDAFPRAQRMLDETHVVVISGVPGIGKTTLADTLLYAHLENGYEPVVVQGGIAEAKKLFDKTKHQIFYFDDFLGATFFQGRSDLIDHNQDASLVSFIDAVRRTKGSRFVMTTREHVLRNALALSERLAHSEILSHRCVLELEDYSYAQKARILYNHLYFSDLPIEYKEAVLNDEFYLEIVKHKNFSPRIIEWLSGYVRVQQVPPDQYRHHVSGLLDSPERIWSYAFDRQISEAARSLLLATAGSRYGIDIIDLEPIWSPLHQHRAQKYNFTTTPSDFQRALDELEGSFIRIHEMSIDFANASIHDFVDNVLRSSRGHIEDILESAVRFNQISHLFALAQEHPSPALAACVTNEPALLLASLERVLYGPHLRWTKKRSGGAIGTFLDTYPETRLQLLVEWTEQKRSTQLLRVANLLADHLITGWGDYLVPDINPAIAVLEAIDASSWVLENGGSKLRVRMLEILLEHLWLARYYEWDKFLQYHRKTGPWSPENETMLNLSIKRYKEDGIEAEAKDCDSTSELEELRDGLIALQKEHDFSLDSQISDIEHALEDRQEDEASEHSSYASRQFSGERNMPEPANDDEIRSLFSTLID